MHRDAELFVLEVLIGDNPASQHNSGRIELSCLTAHQASQSSTADQTQGGVNSSHLPAGAAHFSSQEELLGWRSGEEVARTLSGKNNFDHYLLIEDWFDFFQEEMVATFPLGCLKVQITAICRCITQQELLFF